MKPFTSNEGVAESTISKSTSDTDESQPNTDAPDTDAPGPNTDTSEPNVDVNNSPNVMFIGKKDAFDKDGNPVQVKLDPDEIPTEVRDGTLKISLPPGEAQLKGFYSEDADILIGTFPKLYKRIVEKGEK